MILLYLTFLCQLIHCRQDNFGSSDDLMQVSSDELSDNPFINTQQQQQQHTRISVGVGPGQSIEQTGASSTKKVDLHATPATNNKQDIVVHIHDDRNNQQLNEQSQRDAQDITNTASQTDNQATDPCERYIEQIQDLEREKASMAIQITSLEVKIKEMQQENQMYKSSSSKDDGEVGNDEINEISEG